MSHLTEKSEQYLEEIRAAAGLPRAVLQKIVVDGMTATFYLLTDVTYSAEDERHAQAVSERYLPEGFSARVKIVKSVPDEEGVRRRILEVLRVRFPAAAAFISPQDLEVVCDKTGGRFFISVGSAERAQFSSGEVLDRVSDELKKRFCGAWYGNVKLIEREEQEIEREAPPPAEEVRAPRFFPVENYEAIDGAEVKLAKYIDDLEGEEQGVTICGTITFMQEKETSKGKPYFRFTLSDGSGTTQFAYFTKKATLEKVRALKVGDSVCFTGDNELFNGSLSFRAKAVDYGTPPAGYVFEQRPSRPVPVAYKTVFPEPTSDFRQSTLFGEAPLPADLVAEQFVVFDLETTGLTTSGGAMDRIIEVGAVKILGGNIVEKFSSFVACPNKLSAEIIELTGIDDSMLVGAPTVEEVLPDFFKFCDGCILVGHNIPFDYKFIRHYGEKQGYVFQNRQMDTLTIAQEVLRLSNYKLNTVADHYGFTFQHHRAYDDAFVTAKIFIELVKEKKCLPK